MLRRNDCEAAICDTGSATEGVAGSKKGSGERKGRLNEAKRSRRAKQLAGGGAFVALLAGAWVYPWLGYFIPVCMVAGIGLAVFKGRTWCNWMCPRGSFADAMLSGVSPGKTIPLALRSTPVRAFMIAVLMGVLGSQIAMVWPDARAIGRVFVVLLSITTGVGILLALIWHQRVWCYICPIGTMSNWVGKNRQPLHMAEDRCTECSLCAKACPMQLSPSDLKANDAMACKGDCLKCGLCVETCPKQALSF
jgi:ferredoxin-type protein NapH